MKIRSVMAKAFSTTLVAAMLMAGVPEAAGIQTPFAVTAQAAKKKTVKKKKKTKKVKKKYKENPKLSRTRLSIRNKKTATVKVSGTKKTISVTSSDKSIATVSRSGKYAFRIKAAKKKKGVAVIRVKTSRGYRYVFVQIGGRTNMSKKTRAWAQAGGFIQVPQPSTPQAQQPQTVPSVPSQPSVTQPQPQQPSVTQPETKAPETQPETRQPETQPQTQPSTPSDDDYELTWNGAVILHDERDLAATYDAKVAELCGVNNPGLSKWQKLYNFIRWFSYTYPYNVVGDFNSYYPFVWKRDLEMYPEDAPNFGYNCGCAADVVIAWAHKYIGSPTNHDNGPGHSAVVKANDYNGHFYARIEIDGEYYIAEPRNYQNDSIREDLKTDSVIGLLDREPISTNSRYHPNNVGY